MYYMQYDNVALMLQMVIIANYYASSMHLLTSHSFSYPRCSISIHSLHLTFLSLSWSLMIAASVLLNSCNSSVFNIGSQYRLWRGRRCLCCCCRMLNLTNRYNFGFVLKCFFLVQCLTISPHGFGFSSMVPII